MWALIIFTSHKTLHHAVEGWIVNG